MSVSLCPTFGVGYQAFTTGGLPLNAGLIYTYIAGGTTPQATYTTSAGNVQNANPIVLGADGRPPSEIWLTDTASYRFDVKDSLGTLIKSYDNISSALSSSAMAASSGSSLVGFIRSETGATARTLQDKGRDVISINDFGADPSASAATNTTAIQNAINAATVLGKRITGNAGTYLITPATSSTDEGGAVTVAFLMASNMHFDTEPGCTFKISNNVSTDSVPKKLAMFHTNGTLTNVSFRNLTMDFNGANNKISPSRPSSYNRYNMAHISVSGTPAGVAARMDDVLIEHCSFINTPGTNCIVAGQSATASVTLGKRWTVRDCLFNNNGLDTDDHSCYYAWVDDAITDGNTFTADTMQGTTGSTGMTVAYEVHGANHRFVNNKIRNAYRGMWVSANLTSDVSNTIIQGNTISPVKAYGVDFFREDASATAVYKTLIANNAFGISNDSGAPSPRAAVNIASSYQVRDILICDNIAESVDTTVGSAFVQITPQAVAGQYPTGVVINDNNVLAFTMGVLIATNATNGMGTLKISNNNWRNFVVATVFTVPLGIDGSRITTGAVSNLELVGNTATDTRGGGAVMQYGISLAGTITTLYLKGNDATGMTVAAYLETGTTITNRKGDQSGTWTPTRNGFTEVLGGGTITTSGTYRMRDDLCTVTATITAAGGATIAAVAGTSYLSGLPVASSVNTPGTWVNATSIAASGATLTASGNLYTATAWGAATNVWVLTATYPTA